MPLSSRRIGVAVRRHILLPAYLKYVKHSGVLVHLHELQIQQWNTLEENRAIQARKLHQLLKYASESISYYKTVVQERGIKIGEDRIFDDLKKFPLLTKKIIREHSDGLYRFRDNTYHRNTSGGSTGEPVVFYQDGAYGDWAHAAKLLFNEWAGANIGVQIVQLWGSERDILQAGRGLKRFLSEQLYGIVLLNSFRMTEEDMYTYVQTIAHLRPRLILSYVSSIKELAHFVRRNHLSVYCPHAIMTSAGVLYDKTKEEIKEVFGAPVFNRYGSREVGDMACDCAKHQGLHVLPRIHYLELIDENGNTIKEAQIPGEIAITVLTNYTMPLIRYCIGDRAEWAAGRCTCGRGLPALKSVKGRIVDVFRTANGALVDGEYFSHLFYFRKSVRRYQVIQEARDRIEIKVALEKGEEMSWPNDRQEIQNGVRRVFGSVTKILFQVLDDIPPSPSGKYLYTISKVGDEQD